MKIDPIALEIIAARLREIIMTSEYLLFHSGYSTILRESHDGSAVILDTEGNVVESSGNATKLIGYRITTQGVLKRYPLSKMREGDGYISNDPYSGGMLHVPDVAIIMPIFVDGEIIGFMGSHAHKPDVGGLVPGSSGAGSREIFHEGLLLPGVLYWTKDGPVEEVEAIIKTNCRIPEIIEGDLHAQVGCNIMGVERVQALCKEFGREAIKAAFSTITSTAAQRVRAGLLAWPDGESEAECGVDDDGVDFGKPLRIHVKVIKKGDHITFDFSQTNAQVKGPTNLRPQASEVATLVALVTMIDPKIPFNGGVAAPVTFINPEGKITNPKFPAPVNNYFGLTNVLYSTVNKALSKFNPTRAVASPGLGLGAISVGYDEDRSGRKAVQYELFVTSQGGKRDHDGSLGTTGFNNNTPNTPIEVIETEFPIRVRCYEWIKDSAGAGHFRGGLGNRKEYELLGDATVTLRLGHQFHYSGWGVFGGKNPDTVRAFMNLGTDRERPLKPLETLRMAPGDSFTVEMPGGGGYEDPKLRTPEKVLEDVLNQYVSIERAERDYAVAIDPATLKIDAKRTAALRKAG